MLESGRSADAPAGLLAADTGPRNLRIANVLRQEIAGGRYPIGSSLPTEAELCQRFDVSRYTVREALRRLSDLGLVASRQGSGTRVIALMPRASYVHTLQSLAEISQYTRDTVLDIRATQMVALSAEEAERIPAPQGSRWLRLTALRRTVDDEPIAFAIIYVHGRFAPIVATIPRKSGPIYAHIERHTGEIVMEARQIITGASMPLLAADTLRCKAGAPAVQVLRRYLDVSGGPMLTAVNWHPADRFTYAMTLRRDTGEAAL